MLQTREAAHQLLRHARREHLRLLAPGAQLLQRVAMAHLYVDRREARLLQQGPILVPRERAGDAARPAQRRAHLLFAHRQIAQVAVDDDVGDRHPAPWAQHPERLAQHARLVGRQVHDAVGEDHIHRGVGQRQLLDVALAELHVRHAEPGRVAARQLQHLVRHVHAVDEARGSHALGGQEHVDPAAGAQVHDHLAGPQRRDGRRVAAAVGDRGRLFGDERDLVGPVQGDPAAGVAAVARWPAAGTRGAHPFPVMLAHRPRTASGSDSWMFMVSSLEDNK